jgi:hypothetical protein
MLYPEWWLLLISEDISSMLILVLNLLIGQPHYFNKCYSRWLSRMHIISITYLPSFESFHPLFVLPSAHTHTLVSGSLYISLCSLLPDQKIQIRGPWWSLINVMNGESMLNVSRYYHLTLPQTTIKTSHTERRQLSNCLFLPFFQCFRHHCCDKQNITFLICFLS